MATKVKALWSLSPVEAIVALMVIAGFIENRYPPLSIAAIGVVSLRAIATRIKTGLGFKRTEWAVVACLTYWVANYFWSTGDINNFFSYDFLRQDGAFLVSYTTFLFLLGWVMKPRLYERFWLTLATILALIAVPGAIYALNLPRPGFFDDLLAQAKLLALDQNGGYYLYLGWYEGHNTVGGVYALVSVMGFVLLLQQRFKGRARFYAWFVLVCSMAGLIFSYSRGNYLAFLVGALYALPLRKMTKAAKTALAVLIPALILVFSTSSVVGRIDTITDPEFGTNASRFAIWGEALKDFSLSPIVGIGCGRFNDYLVKYQGEPHLLWVGTKGIIINDSSHAHNSTLHFLAEGGIIGFAVVAFVWWSAWAELSYYEEKLRKWKQHWLIPASKACLIAAVTESMTEHLFGRGSVLLILSALIGTTLAAVRLEEAAVKVVERRAARLTEPSAGLVPASRQPVAVR